MILPTSGIRTATVGPFLWVLYVKWLTYSGDG